MKKGLNLFCNLFLAPAFIIYIVFIIFAVVLTFYYGMTDWDGVGQKTFIWFNNYIDMIQDREYWLVVKNTFTVVILSLVYQVPVGLVLAYLVYRTRSGFKFFRSVNFIPVVISSAAVAVMFSSLLNDDVGPVNVMLRSLGLDFLTHQWLSDPKVVLYAVALPQLWHSIGIAFIIFLAGLQTVPEEVIESSMIDGANSIQVFFRIIIPMIWEVISIVIILAVTGSLKSFDHSWIMTWGGPGLSSSSIAVRMYRAVFREFQMGYGSAMAVSILVYSLFFTVIFKKLTSGRSIRKSKEVQNNI